MNLNQAFSIVISFLISEASTKEYTDKLEIILSGLKEKNQNHIDQEVHPRHLSLLFFGSNIFNFSDNDYISMAELLQG